MKLNNQGESFDIVYNAKDYTIPKGEFEVTNEHLGFFIYNKAIRWGKNVIISDDGAHKEIQPEIKPEIKVVQEAPKEVVKTVVEEVVIEEVDDIPQVANPEHSAPATPKKGRPAKIK